MKRKTKSYISYLWCLPPMLVSWLLVLLIRLLWGSKLYWIEGTLWCELREGSWLQKRYKRSDGRKWGGTTFIMGGIYNVGVPKDTEEIDTRVERHEHLHVEQTKGAQLHSFIIGFATFIVLCLFNQQLLAIWLGLSIWSTGGVLSYICHGIQAKLDGGEFYRDNHMEEAARALDN